MAFPAQIAKLLPKSMRVLSQAGTRQNTLPFHLPCRDEASLVQKQLRKL